MNLLSKGALAAAGVLGFYCHHSLGRDHLQRGGRLLACSRR